MRTCKLFTLGCKVNQYDTQFVRETLEANGYRAVGEGERADLVVVNTCTVTHEADAKARQLIRQLHHCEPRAGVVVLGCYATREPDALRRLPGVVKVVTDKTRLVEELKDFGVRHAPAGISRFDQHQRAFVKVQDGCLLNCTFCIIPSVRPTLRSRTIEEIEAEVYRLLQHGHREIVLAGIHLGHYGIDLSRGRPRSEWVRLWHLLDRLGDLPGQFRIRLSSLEAAEVRDDLIQAVAANRRVVPHLHLCLQSGSDRVLARMKRRYRAASFLRRCDQVRLALDTPALTTDVIVGFPGESETDFAETCRVVRAASFSKVHVFPFSPRRGTPAAEMPEQMPPGVISERKSRLRELERELRRDFARQLLGRRIEVLVERVAADRPGHVVGTACRHLPTVFRAGPETIRQLVAVRVTGYDGERLVATVDRATLRKTPHKEIATSADTLIPNERWRLPLPMLPELD